MTAAICYTATDGYLFQTVVSALQARRASGAPVFVCHIGAATSRERQVFSEVCEDNGVTLLDLPADALEGFPTMYSRFWFHRVLPAEVGELVYLDGDTQVVGDLSPLVQEPGAGRVLAAPDPMVVIREAHARLGKRIDGWWDESHVPAATRARYLNAGVLKMSRQTLLEVSHRLLASGRASTGLRFQDQDWLNLECADLVAPMSVRWNFPGFFLDTAAERATDVRVVHFMSSPRPWNAPLPAWGREFYEAYEEFVGRYPATRPYWNRLTPRDRVKYTLLQAYKRVDERPRYSSPAALRALAALEEEAAF